ncbi:rRNA maturation RNase YbeY [Methylobacillus gramineus]|uniref:rRNA maturation RNase YbeY n=1 Tax=Methylobacillus gramineus TaxID=755169 RepID=UPI001CFFC296|nr:rRNA maturation RNase YbeY [Methylobacillus gramineus]MCB5185042.1 rRNA maturation RNase YbeY [Methylobacillus gramineus]
MPKLALSVQYASEAAEVPSEKQFRKWARHTLRVDTEATLRIVDEEEGRTLNRDYRGKDYATNVLTFPLVEEPWLIGDIILCAPVVAREASEQGKTVEAHYAHMTVHGILHLHGYDHEEEAQAELMESLESSILSKLGYADPYLSEKTDI